MALRTHRREVLRVLSTLGIGTTVFQRALARQATEAAVTREMIIDAEWVAGTELSEEQRDMASEALTGGQQALGPLREVELEHGLAPSMVFQPLPDAVITDPPSPVKFSESAALERPPQADELAFLPVKELAALIRQRKVTSTELTSLYLERLRRFNPLLKCVVTFTETLALEQAAKADREIAAGHYRGPLHGIPWGAKDLLSYPGYPTTWGAPQYRNQRLDVKAAAISKLEAAGAVLVAKLTSGHYALGDQWFGGRTRNPWNPKQGSSGSSAGSASATAAGLVGFSLGTETMGSITSPSRRCGVTGLRPSFGRVSRFGCMPLSWSLDKIGPICRSVEDCAVVLGAIHGADDRDPAAVDRPFAWPPSRTLPSIRVGYDESKQDQQKSSLDVLRGLGVKLIPMTVTRNPLHETLRLILTTESAAIFEELTRRQEPKGVKYWPKTWVMGQFISAIDYLRAHRVRRQLMEEMQERMRHVDVIVGADILLETNMTGHPQIAVPNGFRKRDDVEVPTSLYFTGRLHDETTLLTVAEAYQAATEFHLRRPPLEDFLARREDFHQEDDLLDEQKLY